MKKAVNITEQDRQPPKDPQLLKDPNHKVPDSVTWMELSGFNLAFLIQDLYWDQDGKLIKSEGVFYILVNTIGVFN